MSIRNPAAFLASIWNWKPLCPCFPRGVEPTDIDGWVELGGYFLLLEGKGPGVPVPSGQRQMFARMQRWNQIVPGLFTIIVIWGDAVSGRIDRLQFWPQEPFDSGWGSLIGYVSAWAEWAEERAAIEDEARRAAAAVSPPSPTPRPAAPQPALRPLHADDIRW